MEDKDKKISFLPVMNIRVDYDKDSDYVPLYLMSSTEEDVKLVKGKIRQGQEAIEILARIQGYYEEHIKEKKNAR